MVKITRNNLIKFRSFDRTNPEKSVELLGAIIDVYIHNSELYLFTYVAAGNEYELHIVRITGLGSNEFISNYFLKIDVTDEIGSRSYYDALDSACLELRKYLVSKS